MKRFLQGAAVLLGAGLFSLNVKAQQKVTVDVEEPNSIVLVSTDKAGDEIIRIMKETQSPRFHDPKAPRFVLTDRQGRFALGIGGSLRAVGEYDFGGISDNVDFFPTLIPNKGQSFVRNQFQMDATTSSLFVKLVGRTKKLGDFIVYTAGNFRGGSKVFELQNAYASFLGFTIGYDYGTFMDLSAVPPTIDWAGPSGMLFYRATQLRYEHKLGGGVKAGIAIEMPVVDGITNQHVEISNQRMPNFPAYLQYGWNSNSHIRVSGILRSMTYDNLVAQRAESKIGWGVQASTTFNLGSHVNLFGQGIYGRGISLFMNDLSNLNVDLVPDPDKSGKMQALPMMGWYAGLQYTICPKVFVSTTYSQTRLYSDNDYPKTPSEQYRYGQYLVANMFWNVTKDMQVGAEYLHGWRTDFNDQTRQANRVNLLVQYNF